MAGEKSKILVIGGTGKLGKCVVEASLEAGHPTFVLIRDSSAASSDAAKSALIHKLRNDGALFIHGDINDVESLVKAAKLVHVVISCIGGFNIADQLNIIQAIKEAANIKRFIPSEFGCDVDRSHALSPAAEFLNKKAKIRRAIEAQGIPHTYVCCYGFAGYYLPTLAQENATAPPRDKVVILGDGNAQTINVEEKDIASYTIMTVDDPATLNRVLYVRPPANILSFNEIVRMWEGKIGKTLERSYIPEDQLVKDIQGSPFPRSLGLSLKRYAFAGGLSQELKLKQASDLEATHLYPQVKYTSVQTYLDRFV